MRIAVNTRLLLKDRLEGIGYFAHETLKRITQAHPEHQFLFIFDRAFDAQYIYNENVMPLVAHPQARHPFLYYLWFEWSIPALLKKHKTDLFLSPDGYLSLSTKVPQVGVFHDLAFEHYPKDISFWGRKYYQYYFPKFAKKASRLVTVSEYSKQDIVEQYRTPQDKIDVVHNGAAPVFQPISEAQKQKIRATYTQGAPYFVYVGAIHPRKNVSTLLKAFDQFKEQVDSSTKLLIVGRKAWQNEELDHIFNQMKYRDEVVFTGRLDQSELANVVAGALGLTYISYFEGFGIPLLEAMNCDVPVITSNLTSMPEVAGEAALLVDPFSSDSVTQAMISLDQDSKLQEQLIVKGREQRQKFSWDKTADLLWNSIMKVAKP